MAKKRKRELTKKQRKQAKDLPKWHGREDLICPLCGHNLGHPPNKRARSARLWTHAQRKHPKWDPDAAEASAPEKRAEQTTGKVYCPICGNYLGRAKGETADRQRIVMCAIRGHPKSSVTRPAR